MAFPSIDDENTSAEGSATTSHAVSLPANISAGDLLIVFFATDTDNTISDWDDFTELFNTSQVNNCSLSVAYKIATGSEGATITVTTANSTQSAHVSYRITGHDSTNLPEVSTGATSGLSANPDPDSLTAGGGSKEYLWIAVEGNDDDDAVTVYPSNYGLSQNTKISNTGSGTCHIGVAGRNVEAETEDPGAFTIAVAEQWIACTVAVYPSAGAIHEPSDTAKASDGIGFKPKIPFSDLAKASDSPAFKPGIPLSDTAKASDGLTTKAGSVLSDTAKASDSIVFKVFHGISDTARAQDIFFPNKLTLTDIAKASDSVTYSFISGIETPTENIQIWR